MRPAIKNLKVTLDILGFEVKGKNYIIYIFVFYGNNDNTTKLANNNTENTEYFESMIIKKLKLQLRTPFFFSETWPATNKCVNGHDVADPYLLQIKLFSKF